MLTLSRRPREKHIKFELKRALIGESRVLYQMTNAQVRRLARHLVRFPDPRRSKILTSIPSDDRIRVFEEIKRIKDDSPQDNRSRLLDRRSGPGCLGLRFTLDN